MVSSSPSLNSPTPPAFGQPAEPSSQPSPLARLLSSALPASSPPFDIHHISHPPTRCDPLYSPPISQKAPRTTLTSHVLALSSPSNSILVYAIEVHIYTTRTRTTIFVSKADSTGFFPKSSTPQAAAPPRGAASPIRAVTTAFLQYLIDTTRRPGTTTHLTLFARAQDQYLFPNSVRNKGKHVLSDIQLIRWWAKVLDPILNAPVSVSDGDANQSPPSGYILVPGLDRVDLRHVFPSQRWVHGHPYDDPTLPVRQCIPHFEDDPKSRFMDELEEQGWRDVPDMKQFWELMAFRQECSLGKSVGFLSVLFKAEGKKSKGHRRSKSDEERAEGSATSPQESPPKKKVNLPPDLLSASSFTIASLLRNPETRSEIAKRASTLTRRTSSFTSSITGTDGIGKSGRVLSKRDYDKLMASLLDSDFEGIKCAKESSELWIKMAGVEKLPERSARPEDSENATVDGEEIRINDLSIRKRKSDIDPVPTAAVPNVLQPRKKSKPQLEVPTTPVANVLQPRKKETPVTKTNAEAKPAVNILQPRKKAKPEDQKTAMANDGNETATTGVTTQGKD
ncbi:hypothetical protein TWF696_003738 [Orbilia brochopaga]|uniref:histone acetyltransferase n=1 Tax=Orbilia brochopaga TaxID=3140254 RepID=A0AAV9V3Z8_9PEZI